MIFDILGELECKVFCGCVDEGGRGSCGCGQLAAQGNAGGERKGNHPYIRNRRGDRNIT
jgi:hypothetical protein